MGIPMYVVAVYESLHVWKNKIKMKKWWRREY